MDMCCCVGSGQRCTAVKVVLVMESVADALVEAVKAKVAKLTVGAPEDDCDITPVVSESSANFIEGLVMDAREKGATFCQEYKREGNLIWPLLLDHVRPDMRIAWEEPFGPVLPVIRIGSVEEGIHHCNASNFGLQVDQSSMSLYIFLCYMTLTSLIFVNYRVVFSPKISTRQCSSVMPWSLEPFRSTPPRLVARTIFLSRYSAHYLSTKMSTFLNDKGF